MEITNPSSLPCQPLADLSGKARDYALCKVLWWTRTRGNLHCHNVKCSPYSTALVFFLWDIRGWRGAYCFPARANVPQKCNPLWKTTALPLYDLLHSLSGFIKTFNHLCGWLTPWRWPILSPFCTSLLAGKKLLYQPVTLVYIFSPYFLLLLSLLARKLCSAMPAAPSTWELLNFS